MGHLFSAKWPLRLGFAIGMGCVAWWGVAWYWANHCTWFGIALSLAASGADKSGQAVCIARVLLAFLAGMLIGKATQSAVPRVRLALRVGLPAMALAGSFLAEGGQVSFLLVGDLLAVSAGLWSGVRFLAGVPDRRRGVIEALVGVPVGIFLLTVAFLDTTPHPAAAGGQFTRSDRQAARETLRQSITGGASESSELRLPNPQVLSLIEDVWPRRGSINTVLRGNRATVHAAVPLTPLGGFLNLHAQGTAAIQQGRLSASLERLAVGRISLPSFVNAWIARQLVAEINRDRTLAPLLARVEHLAIDEGMLSVKLVNAGEARRRRRSTETQGPLGPTPLFRGVTYRRLSSELANGAGISVVHVFKVDLDEPGLQIQFPQPHLAKGSTTPAFRCASPKEFVGHERLSLWVNGGMFAPLGGALLPQAGQSARASETLIAEGQVLGACDICRVIWLDADLTPHFEDRRPTPQSVLESARFAVGTGRRPLVLNGRVAPLGNGAADRRTGIGIDSTHRKLLLACSDYCEAQTMALALIDDGAEFALPLDGGGSTSFAVGADSSRGEFELQPDYPIPLYIGIRALPITNH